MAASSDFTRSGNGSLSLARFVRDRYWPVLSAGLARSSVGRERAILARLVDHLGPRLTHQLEPEHLEMWWARLRASRKPATCNRHLVRVRHCLRTGVRWKLLAADPTAGISKLKPPKGRVKWLTDEQRARLIAAADPALQIYILAGRYTAGRLSTLIELRRRDLDLEAMTVTFPITKNGDAHMVPLHPTLLAALGTIPDEPDAFVLPRVHRCSVGRAFTRLVTRLGIGDFHFHDLRHDVATTLVSQGAGLPIIMAALGHRDPRMSVRYTHVTAETLRGAMRGL
jgi:integrase